MKQKSNFEEEVKAWLNAQSPEGRAAALSVKDKAFLFTLIHFGSSSWSSANSSEHQHTAGMEDTGASIIDNRDCEEFLMSDIENTYSMFSERFAVEAEPSLSMDISANPTVSSSSTKSKHLIADACFDGGNTFMDNVQSPQLSLRQLSKASDATVGANDEERIRRMSTGSDAFSIRRSTDMIKSSRSSDVSQFADRAFKPPHFRQEMPKEQIVKELVLIFPSVFGMANEHGLRCCMDYPQLDTNAVPILSLSPTGADAFILNCPLLDVFVEREKPSWIDALRRHAEMKSPSDSQPTVTLSLMLVSRMQMSLTEAFLFHKHGYMMNASDCEEEQSSVDQYTTSREDEESDEIEVDECRAETIVATSTMTSNRVPRKARNHTIPLILSSTHASQKDQVEMVPCKKEINEKSIRSRSIFSLPEILKTFALDSDLEDLRSFPRGLLPFVPLQAVMGFSDVEIMKVDHALGKLLLSILPKAIEAGALSGMLSRTQDQDATDLLVVSSPNAVDTESTNLEEGQNSFSSKKKKKKKKNKRKNSSAESVCGKDVALSIPCPQLTGPVASVKAETPIEAADAEPFTVNSSRKLPAVDFLQSPSLAPGDSLETDCDKDFVRIFVPEVDVSSSVTPEGGVASIEASQLDAVEPSCVVDPPSELLSSSRDILGSPTETVGDADDDDAWETVEAKGKSKNRNKTSELKSRSSQPPQNGRHSTWSARSKVKGSRSIATWKRIANKKVVREVLTSLLDSVELEVKRSRITAEKISEDRHSRESQNGRVLGSSAGLGTDQLGSTSAPISMRDIVLGVQRTGSAKESSVLPSQVIRSKPESTALCTGVVRGSLLGTNKKISDVEVRSKGTQTLTPGADRSTAPTLPETVSGASANTQSSFATDEIENLPDRVRPTGADIVVDDSSSAAAGVDEIESNKTTPAVSTEDESSPPLSTLLGPGNTNSATSSVASSLEAPHASKHRHHHSCNENDVGYHLLDVCNRLSRDMNVFMARRSLALVARRRERSALLGALQDTISSIWSNHGKVEMYGSCATQLDLPSSDLDAVILGLDAPVDLNSPSRVSMKELLHRDVSQARLQNGPMHPYGRLSSNGERVIILAAELERQAWAVQVKAIPTASVPVVKILADPSKLPGALVVAGSNGNWLIRQHHIAAEAAAVATGSKPPPSPSAQASRVAPIPQGQARYPPWRGADVMNGLFSIDVTFDGPEHGGIGSTRYSAAVVQKACAESGLHPEETPFVQVLMVLKELLAQRRLNEPFSGGLSSYALLLLVNAVAKERAIIREEMERIERHRELVVAEDTAILSHNFDERNVSDSKAQKDNPSPRKSNGMVANGIKPSNLACPPTESLSTSGSNSTNVASSWASIAKMSMNAPTSVQATQGSTPKATRHESQSSPSFAEAVTRNQQPSQRANHATTGGRRTEKHPDSHEFPVTAEAAEVVPELANVTPHASAQHVSQPLPVKQGTHGANLYSKTNSFVSLDASLSGAPSLFPQGSDDVLEVLCSGEISAGKLLMHFLLYYGEHFDSRSISIDVVGNCYPDHADGFKPPNGHTSPYIPRRSGGTIDPVTGMLNVDPIVVYDPWEGGRGSNVARSCYAWSSIQWHFAQCYMTLSSAVERCVASPTSATLDASAPRKTSLDQTRSTKSIPSCHAIVSHSIEDSKKALPQPPSVDVVSPLLELLLSF